MQLHHHFFWRGGGEYLMCHRYYSFWFFIITLTTGRLSKFNFSENCILYWQSRLRRSWLEIFSIENKESHLFSNSGESIPRIPICECTEQSVSTWTVSCLLTYSRHFQLSSTIDWKSRVNRLFCRKINAD